MLQETFTNALAECVPQFIYFLAEPPNLIPLTIGNMATFHRPFIPS